MKTKLLELFNKRYNTDSKSESWKYEKEICNILQSAINRIWEIEEAVGWHNYLSDYHKIKDIFDNYCYTELPNEIICNEGHYVFNTKLLDINHAEYFESLKGKSINYKNTIIENVENSLIKHKEELEKLKNLTYDGERIK